MLNQLDRKHFSHICVYFINYRSTENDTIPVSQLIFKLVSQSSFNFVKTKGMFYCVALYFIEKCIFL